MTLQQTDIVVRAVGRGCAAPSRRPLPPAEAVRLLDGGGPGTPRPAPKARRPEIPMPDDFAALLRRHPAAASSFEKFSPSHRREYLAWIVGAKREATRARRMATALEWLAQGKTREWKYQS